MFHGRICNMGRVTPAKPEIGGVGPSEISGAINLKAVKISSHHPIESNRHNEHPVWEA